MTPAPMNPESMTDERIAEISARLTAAWLNKQSSIPRSIGDELLAEVERLRTGGPAAPTNDPFIGRRFRERSPYFAHRVVLVERVADEQRSPVGATVRSTVYECAGENGRRTRIQSHVLRSKWVEVTA